VGRPFFRYKEDYDSWSQYAARQGLEGAPHGGHDVSDLQAQTEGAQTAAVSTEEQETGSLAILPGITSGPGFLSLGFCRRGANGTGHCSSAWRLSASITGIKSGSQADAKSSLLLQYHQAKGRQLEALPLNLSKCVVFTLRRDFRESIGIGVKARGCDEQLRQAGRR